MKKIAITMGDPAGVGPEIIVRSLMTEKTHGLCMPVVFGDRQVIEEAMRLAGAEVSVNLITTPQDAAGKSGKIDLIDIGGGLTYEKGRPTAAGGKACASYIKSAVLSAMAGEVDGIVTAPISKEALKMAGLNWPGHTEMLAELSATREYAMMLVGGPLRVILVTIHTSIRSVPDRIKKDAVLKIIRLAFRACAMLGIPSPRISVAGLNPHAGEAGLFGDEELKEIAPAVAAAQDEGISVSGPYPPDTLFFRAYRGETDIVVCMYHDQGLIPLKMIAFESGVNVTVGLPFVRTSPDHGTAYDIAWKGLADPSSMIEAIKLAVSMKPV